MPDKLTPEKRSWNMSRIKGKDTSIEIKVRKYLFSLGYRFRKNDRRLPGTPDIVLPKYKSVIFINGCFWHRHIGCAKTTTPKSNLDFWERKFDRTIANDRQNYAELEKQGWNVIVLWECELKKEKFATTMQRVVNELDEIWIEKMAR